MSDFPSQNEQQRLEGLFAQAAALPLEPPPFLATRVAAQAAAKLRDRRQLSFWRRLSAGLAACAAVAAVVVVVVVVGKRPPASPETLAAVVNKPHVVMVKLQELPALASAEIELPDGVYFYSESIPGLKEKRELRLAWSPGAKPYLPFVVKGETEGARQVTLRFRGAGGELLEERRIEIFFRKGKS